MGVIGCCLTLILGCGERGPKLTPVTGTLTQNGTPLGDVSIEFRKQDTGASSFADVDAAGQFTLTHMHGGTGAEPGKYFVYVWRTVPVPPPAGVRPEDLRPDQRNLTKSEPIPNSDGSPIEVDIGEGTQTVNVDVK